MSSLSGESDGYDPQYSADFLLKTGSSDARGGIFFCLKFAFQNFRLRSQNLRGRKWENL